MKYRRQSILLLFFFTIFFSKLVAQDKNIQALVDSQSYVFQAQTAAPLSGNFRQLTYGYDFTVTKNKIVAYLPYFGRAYVTPVDLSDGGIKFTSTDFEYNVAPGKKSSWEITLKPKDVNTVQSLFLRIFSNGTASISITPAGKDAISFDGYVEPIKIKKEKKN